MCLHASWMPAEQCTRCTPAKRYIERGLDTGLILHDQETSERFDAQTSRIGECLVFQHANETHWGFRVKTCLGFTIITPTRYALSRAGRRATDVQTVRCSCERTGDKHGNGVCVNPDHLIAY